MIDVFQFFKKIPGGALLIPMLISAVLNTMQSLVQLHKAGANIVAGTDSTLEDDKTPASVPYNEASGLKSCCVATTF